MDNHEDLSLIPPLRIQATALVRRHSVSAEVQANNTRIQELSSEKGEKVAQNVAAGVAGLFIPVLWLGMDWQGAAGTEEQALNNRQQYLATLAAQRCAPAKQASPPAPARKQG